MSIYIQRDTDGAIVSWAKQPEIGYEEMDFDGELVRGYDEKFYKPGEEPTPPLAEAQTAKRMEINAGFDAALAASLTMPSRDTPPSVVELAIAIADFKADDPAGLTDLQSIHETRRLELLAAVDAATTIAEVQAISVTYAV